MRFFPIDLVDESLKLISIASPFGWRATKVFEIGYRRAFTVVQLVRKVAWSTIDNNIVVHCDGTFCAKDGDGRFDAFAFRIAKVDVKSAFNVIRERQRRFHLQINLGMLVWYWLGRSNSRFSAKDETHSRNGVCSKIHSERLSVFTSRIVEGDLRRSSGKLIAISDVVGLHHILCQMKAGFDALDVANLARLSDFA